MRNFKQDEVKTSPDAKTAAAFSSSWNNLPLGSIYTKDQVEDWFAPLDLNDLKDKEVLELGCGGGNLMVHILDYGPAKLVGVDLGESVVTAKNNIAATGKNNASVLQDDLCTFSSEGFDLVYCIGVLHHLKKPYEGFCSVLRNTRPGGYFHCWVYAYEGNSIIRLCIEPLRRLCSKLPWWLTKYFVATPLAALYYCYAKTLHLLPAGIGEHFPLGTYSLWIAKREFAFFRHVAFDQLVTPQTVYIKKGTIEDWLSRNDLVAPGTTYIIQRNGNSWKFGGRRTSVAGKKEAVGTAQSLCNNLN
jgi:SAM-dependent methyltransferase